MTLVERKSGYSLAAKVSSKDAAEVAATLIKLLSPYKALVRTITFDNGLEFARHAEVSQAIGCKVYLLNHIRLGNAGPTKTSMAYCGNVIPKRAASKCCALNTSRKVLILLIIEPGIGLTGRRHMRYFQHQKTAEVLRLQVETKLCC